MQAKPSVFKSTAWYGAGFLILRAVSFFLLPMYSQVLDPNEFGNYALIMAFYTTALIIYQAGFGIGFTKFYLDEADEAKKKIVLSSILNTVFIISVLLSTIGLFFTNQISVLLLGSPAFAELLFIVFITLFFENISYFLLYYFKTLERSKFVVVITSISSIVNFSFNIFLVYFIELGIQGIIISQLIASSIVVFILVPIIFKDFLFSIDKELIKRIFVFSAPLFVGSIFAILLEVADRFFIDFYLDKGEVGIYSFSYRIALIMNLFVISFRTAWAPRAINNYKEGNYSYDFGQIFTKLITSTVFIFLFVTLLIGDVFNVHIFGFEIFNSSYEPGIAVIPVVLLGYIFSALASFYSVYPLVAGKSRHFLISDFSALAINIVLNIILIKPLGIMGAAVATLAGLSVITIYLWFVSKDKIQVDYEMKKLGLILISGAVCFSFGYLINLFLVDVIVIIMFTLSLKYILDINLTRILSFLKSP